MKICATCPDVTPDLPKWTSIEGGFRPRGPTKTSCVGCKTGRPTCKRQHWLGTVRRWARLCHIMGNAACDLVHSFSDAFDGVQCSPMSDVEIPDIVPEGHSPPVWVPGLPSR